jgi:hypothetical protein
MIAVLGNQEANSKVRLEELGASAIPSASASDCGAGSAARTGSSAAAGAAEAAAAAQIGHVPP